MVLQWKAMRADIEYWKLNYKRMKQVSNLSFFEYLGSDFSFEEKKFDLLQEEIKNGNTYLCNLTAKTKIKTSISLDEIYDLVQSKFKILIRKLLIV